MFNNIVKLVAKPRFFEKHSFYTWVTSFNTDPHEGLVLSFWSKNGTKFRGVARIKEVTLNFIEVFNADNVTTKQLMTSYRKTNTSKEKKWTWVP